MKLTDLRAILQYVPQFREKTFIIAVDGGIVTDENFPNILLDIALLRSLNIRVVVVHGAAEQIQALAQKQNVQPSNLDGSGVTDAATLELAIEAANRVTHEIVGGLSANDLGAATTNVLLDRVEQRNTLQRLGRNWRSLGDSAVIEATPNVRPAESEADVALLRERAIACDSLTQ